jgi:hypothetical protein
MMRRSGWVALLLVAGCRWGGLDLSGDRFACTSDSDCVDGQRCVESLCSLVGADGGALDAGSMDAGAMDAGATDAGAMDAGSMDAGSTDAGSMDAGGVDAGVMDAGVDAGPVDAGPVDAGPGDAGVLGLDAGPLCTAGWCWAHSLPQGNTLNAVVGTSPTDLWGAGDLGTVVHWDGVSLGVEVAPLGDIRAAWRSPSGAIFMVDSAQVAVRRPSGWTVLPAVPNGSTLHGVWGTDDTHVWIVGDQGSVIRWDGSMMTLETTPVPSATLYAVTGLSTSQLWAVGSGGTVLTSTGNGTWTQAASGTSADLVAVLAISATNVWATGNSVLTHFAGAGWATTVTPQAPYGGPANFTGLAFDGTTAVAIANYAGDYKLTGTTWTIENAFNGSDDVAFTIGTCGAGCLVAGGLEGKLFVRRSTGWTSPSPASENSFTATHGSSSTDVWMVGAVIRHWDGATLSLVPWSQSTYLDGVYAASTTAAWAVGYDGSIVQWNGVIWAPQLTAAQPAGSRSFNAVHGSSASDVWAVGNGGLVMHFNGTTWSAVPSGTTVDLWAVNAASPTDVWLGGSSGFVAHGNGSTFTPVTPIIASSGVQVRGVWSNGSHVVVVGELNYGCYLADRASSAAPWTVPLNGASLSGCYAVNGNGGRVWVGVRNDGVGEWVSGSLTPSRISSGAPQGVFSPSPTEAWMVGDNGTIMHFSH